MDRTGRPPARILVFAWVAAAAALVALAWPNLETTVDDAWISARYARNLAEGHGLVFNAGEPPVEGYTNLAWVVLSAGAHAVGLPLHASLVGAGLAFAALGLAAAIPVATRLAGGDRRAGILAAGALACSPHYAVASTNGIESSMFVACTLGAVALALGARSGARATAAGVALALLGTVRPEGLGIAAALSAHHLWERRAELRQPVAWVLPALAAAGVAGIEAWRWATYGALVPNTLAAKSGVPLHRLISGNLDYLATDTWFWWVALALMALAPFVGRRTAEGAVVGVVAWMTVAAAMRVEMWMPAGRLLLPGLALTWCALAATATNGSARTRIAARVALAAVTVGALLPPVHPIVRDYDRRHSVLAENPAALAGRHLAEHAPPGAWLAVRDAGVLAYWVGSGVRVAETHERALTLPHPDGRPVDLGPLPRDPTFLALTQAREEADGFRYDNDRRVFERTTTPYVYLGRVYQHHHRYYDLYAREDAHVPPLPDALVVNRAGPPPKGAPRRR